jgi:hypothetical protein
MTMTRASLAAAFALATPLSVPAWAQDIAQPITTTATCAPQAADSGWPSGDPPRITGAQDASPRTLYGSRDYVVVNAGTAKGLQIGQKFYARRKFTAGYESRFGMHAAITAGWLSIVAVNETTAVAHVDFACDGISQGDFLEPFAPPELPVGTGRSDTTGELDFSSPVRVMFGDYGRLIGGVGDLMLADIGQGEGAAAGARYAVYRDLGVSGVPLAAVGEAILISVGEKTSTFRLTESRDAIVSGDLLIPRKR